MKDTGVIIKLKKVKEHKDGSATFDVDYNKTIMYKMIKKYYGVKRVNKKLVRKFLLKGFTTYANLKRAEHGIYT